MVRVLMQGRVQLQESSSQSDASYVAQTPLPGPADAKNGTGGDKDTQE
jgi:hypothetical protein